MSPGNELGFPKSTFHLLRATEARYHTCRSFCESGVILWSRIILNLADLKLSLNRRKLRDFFSKLYYNNIQGLLTFPNICYVYVLIPCELSVCI